MKKILRIIHRLNLGGPTYNAAYLTKYLEGEYETLLIGGNHEKSEKSYMHNLEDLGIKPNIIPEMQRSINPLLDRIALKKIKEISEEKASETLDSIAYFRNQKEKMDQEFSAKLRAQLTAKQVLEIHIAEEKFHRRMVDRSRKRKKTS